MSSQANELRENSGYIRLHSRKQSLRKDYTQHVLKIMNILDVAKLGRRSYSIVDFLFKNITNQIFLKNC